MFDEKLIIKQFLENQKLATPSNLNAANLTHVLRSLGFFLNEFDMPLNGGNPDDPNLSIEIKCGHSGIISKLYLPHQECLCVGANPPQDKTYWEVQGNQPTSPSCSNRSTVVHETATNLLPEPDHTWKILSKNMFNFMLRMQNDIVQYKDDQNNMQYGEASPAIESVELEVLPVINSENQTSSDTNEEVIPAFFTNKPDTPYSTPLSSINVTPIVSTNTPNIMISEPNSDQQSLMESSISSCPGDSMVISLITDAKAKLEEALLRITINSFEDVFNQSAPMKITPEQNGTSKLQVSKILRRRSTNSNIGSNGTSKAAIGTSKTLYKIPNRLSAGSILESNIKKAEKKSNSPLKRGPRSAINVQQTRTTALRNQQKSKN